MRLLQGRVLHCSNDTSNSFVDGNTATQIGLMRPVKAKGQSEWFLLKTCMGVGCVCTAMQEQPVAPSCVTCA